MKLQRRFKRMIIDVQDDLLLLHVGQMDIWDGADLALLREGMFKLIEKENCRNIAIDMEYVKYIPSGFFGMLFDWYETGVQIRLYEPQPNVRRMIWFNQFFAATAGNCFALAPQPSASLPMGYPVNGSASANAARSQTKKAVARAGR